MGAKIFHLPKLFGHNFCCYSNRKHIPNNCVEYNRFGSPTCILIWVRKGSIDSTVVETERDFSAYSKLFHILNYVATDT